MKITILGKVVAVKEPQKITETFKKQEIWIETLDEKYPQTLAVEFANDKILQLSDIAINEQVQIEATLRGNEHNGKCYTSISGWKLEAKKKGAKAPVKKDDYLADLPAHTNDDLPF